LAAPLERPIPGRLKKVRWDADEEFRDAESRASVTCPKRRAKSAPRNRRNSEIEISDIRSLTPWPEQGISPGPSLAARIVRLRTTSPKTSSSSATSEHGARGATSIAATPRPSITTSRSPCRPTQPSVDQFEKRHQAVCSSFAVAAVVGQQLRLRTMTTYSGPATLVLVDGARVPGVASLRTDDRADPPGWSGSFRPDRGGDDLRNAGDGLELELAFEQAGPVAVTGVRRLLATQVLVSLLGRGPAPF